MVQAAVDRMVRKALRKSKSWLPARVPQTSGRVRMRHRAGEVLPVEDYIADPSGAVAKAGPSVKSLAIEPGKYLVGDVGVLLLGVEYVKEATATFSACVDGVHFQHRRPAGQLDLGDHEIVNAGRIDGQSKARITVAGNLCETGDVFGRERSMPLPESGSILAVRAGA